MFSPEGLAAAVVAVFGASSPADEIPAALAALRHADKRKLAVALGRFRAPPARRQIGLAAFGRAPRARIARDRVAHGAERLAAAVASLAHEAARRGENLARLRFAQPHCFDFAN